MSDVRQKILGIIEIGIRRGFLVKELLGHGLVPEDLLMGTGMNLAGFRVNHLMNLAGDADGPL